MTDEAASCWSVLGVFVPPDFHDRERVIKRAYARKLRELGGAEGDPAKFTELREAYEQALSGGGGSPAKGEFHIEICRTCGNALLADGVCPRCKPARYDDWYEKTFAGARDRMQFGTYAWLKTKVAECLQQFLNARLDERTVHAMRGAVDLLLSNLQATGDWPVGVPIPKWELRVDPVAQSVEFVLLDEETPR